LRKLHSRAVSPIRSKHDVIGPKDFGKNSLPFLRRIWVVHKNRSKVVSFRGFSWQAQGKGIVPFFIKEDRSRRNVLVYPFGGGNSGNGARINRKKRKGVYQKNTDNKGEKENSTPLFYKIFYNERKKMVADNACQESEEGINRKKVTHRFDKLPSLIEENPQYPKTGQKNGCSKLYFVGIFFPF